MKNNRTVRNFYFLGLCLGLIVAPFMATHKFPSQLGSQKAISQRFMANKALGSKCIKAFQDIIASPTKTTVLEEGQHHNLSQYNGIKNLKNKAFKGQGAILYKNSILEEIEKFQKLEEIMERFLRNETNSEDLNFLQQQFALLPPLEANDFEKAMEWLMQVEVDTDQLKSIVTLLEEKKKLTQEQLDILERLFALRTADSIGITLDSFYKLGDSTLSSNFDNFLAFGKIKLSQKARNLIYQDPQLSKPFRRLAKKYNQDDLEAVFFMLQRKYPDSPELLQKKLDEFLKRCGEN